MFIPPSVCSLVLHSQQCARGGFKMMVNVVARLKGLCPAPLFSCFASMASWLGNFKDTLAEVPTPLPGWAVGLGEPGWEDWLRMSSPAAGLCK